MICPYCGYPLCEPGESGTGEDEPVGYCLETEQDTEQRECGG